MDNVLFAIGVGIVCVVEVWAIGWYKRRRAKRKIERLEDQLGIGEYYRWSNRKNRG